MHRGRPIKRPRVHEYLRHKGRLRGVMENTSGGTDACKLLWKHRGRPEGLEVAQEA